MLLTFLVPLTCLAGTEQEVNHLLEFVENSGCVFVRNDKQYNSAKARKHLQKKYNYIKSRVKKAEDFIKYAATESSMTGKQYMILCDGRAEMPSAEWLQAELDVFRKKRLQAVK